MSKNFVKYKVDLPQNNESSVFDLVGNVPTEKFFLDIDRRGKIELSKFKIQTRYATTKFPLVRIDIDSPPHLNPDGTKTSRNHIHIYKDMGTMDTGNLPWAYNLDEFYKFDFVDKRIDFMYIFHAFCKYCNINTDNIQGVV